MWHKDRREKEIDGDDYNRIRRIFVRKEKNKMLIKYKLWIGRGGGRGKLHNLYLKVIWSFKAKSPNFVLSSQQPSFCLFILDLQSFHPTQPLYLTQPLASLNFFPFPFPFPFLSFCHFYFDTHIHSHCS